VWKRSREDLTIQDKLLPPPPLPLMDDEILDTEPEEEDDGIEEPGDMLINGMCRIN